MATWRPVPASTPGEEDPEAEVPQPRRVLFQRSSLLPEDLGAADQWMVGMSWLEKWLESAWGVKAL